MLQEVIISEEQLELPWMRAQDGTGGTRLEEGAEVGGDVVRVLDRVLHDVVDQGVYGVRVEGRLPHEELV